MMNHLFPFQYPTVCLHRLLYAFASHDTFSIWNRHRQKHVLPDFMKAGFKMIFGMISSHHPPPLSKDFFTVSVMYCQHIVCSKFPLPYTTNGGPPSRTHSPFAAVSCYVQAGHNRIGVSYDQKYESSVHKVPSKVH